MRDSVILVTRNGLGHTEFVDLEFGMVMLDKLFHTFERSAERPTAICFYTEGVKVALRDSTCATSLQMLKTLGVSLSACESCVNYYGFDPNSLVADVVGIVQIVQQMSTASKVIAV
jgi:intracellular sulfur oxidation DsrE/DsrF family protein